MDEGVVFLVFVENLVLRPFVAPAVPFEILQSVLEFKRRLIALRLGLILQAHGAQQKGKRRRRGHRAGDGIVGEVRPKNVELILGELEALSQRQVGRVENQEGPSIGGEELAESFFLEDRIVVKLGGQIDAAKIRRQEASEIDRIEQLGDQLLLDVPVEKFIGKFGKHAPVKERVIGGGKRSARDRRDAVHFVQQAFWLAFPLDLDLGEFFQHAVR